MFLDEILQSVRIGLRPNAPAIQTGVALRIEPRAMGQCKGQETKLIRSEHDRCGEVTICALKFSFCDLRSPAFEAAHWWQRAGRYGFRTFPARVELILNLLFALGTGPHNRA